MPLRASGKYRPCAIAGSFHSFAISSSRSMTDDSLRANLLKGHVIPALPLALDGDRRWSQQHQRALVRYYMAAGAGGLAVAVHSTQFAIREPQHGLFEPVLRLAAETMDAEAAPDFLRIAGICGKTEQALQEAELAAG